MSDPIHEMTFEKVASEISGSEGPLVTNDDRIFVVAPTPGEVLEILPDGEKRVLANTGGIPAGLQLHPDGSIWVADMKLGILRVGLDGTVEPMVSEYEGRAIRGCNDCSFDSQGNLYFTAPAGSSGEQPIGEIFCLLADGGVRKLDEGFAFCNGIAVNADDSVLIVAETFTKRLIAYDLASPGRVENKRILITLPGDHRGGPDGMDFDEEGRLIVAHWGSRHLDVVTLDGSMALRVPLPFDAPSNVHFAGRGSRTLLVTEHTNNALWKGEWLCAGQRQYGWPIL